MKPALWVVSLCGLAIVLLISGAQAAQSRIEAAQVSSEATPTPTPIPVEIVIEEPDIHPAYGALCDSYWYSYTNDRGYYAYLTLNVSDTLYSTNYGEWRPTITQPGYYRVEAFIPTHPPIAWECPVKTIPFDTSDAHYTIQHANGQTLVTGTQKTVNNNWLPLGEYLFRPGSEGYVMLTDLNGQTSFTATVSFSALRFSWQRPPPASLFLPLTIRLASSVITSTVGIQNAPALDQCHLPTPAQMQTWWNYSPYRITNVYIGGSLLYHECSVPDANWIEAVQDQGWGTIPTWVGPQAPCSGYRLRMSSDPEVAFQQGQAEADAASLAAWQIGLAGSGMGGTIIYYDVEGYSPTNKDCRDAVKSFISGWTERLHYWGNRSGAYGGACTSYVSDWASTVYPPENLWVAAWNAAKYKKDVSLFGITCLPDTLWPNHQRIRQYAPGHNETYGNVTFNIDSNIADAEVVIPTHAISSLLSSTSYISNLPDILDYGDIQNSPDQSWLITDGILFRNALNHQDWQPIIGPLSDTAIRKAFFLDDRHGWLIATTNEINHQLFVTNDNGQTWQEISTPSLDTGWLPHSLQFTDTQNGWIVVKQLTRSNFSNGVLHRTTDSGKSWQAFDLPIGEAVRFTTPEVGWVAGGVGGNELYHTLDGGRSWRLVKLDLPKDGRITISLPTFTDYKNGVLPVIILAQAENSFITYTTQDGGETWQLRDTYTNLPEGFSTVNFINPQVGWSTTTVGTCRSTGVGKDCTLETILWTTNDGGNTWVVEEIPGRIQ
jgi:photosystem II stability/assembly factor-like uncharacterized protein